MMYPGNKQGLAGRGPPQAARGPFLYDQAAQQKHLPNAYAAGGPSKAPVNFQKPLNLAPSAQLNEERAALTGLFHKKDIVVGQENADRLESFDGEQDQDLELSSVHDEQLVKEL